jgi:hypothetical protein
VVLNETPSSAMVDGKWTFDQVGAKLAMQELLSTNRTVRFFCSGSATSEDLLGTGDKWRVWLFSND